MKKLLFIFLIIFLNNSNAMRRELSDPNYNRSKVRFLENESEEEEEGLYKSRSCIYGKEKDIFDINDFRLEEALLRKNKNVLTAEKIEKMIIKNIEKRFKIKISKIYCEKIKTDSNLFFFSQITKKLSINYRKITKKQTKLLNQFINRKTREIFKLIRDSKKRKSKEYISPEKISDIILKQIKDLKIKVTRFHTDKIIKDTEIFFFAYILNENDRLEYQKDVERGIVSPISLYLKSKEMTTTDSERINEFITEKIKEITNSIIENTLKKSKKKKKKKSKKKKKKKSKIKRFFTRKKKKESFIWLKEI